MSERLQGPEKTDQRSLKIWEFNVLVLESVLLGAGLFALVSTLGQDRFAALPTAPQGVWQGIGFLALMLCLYPVLSIHVRNTRGTRLSFAKLLAWTVIGSVVSVVVFTFLP